MRIKQFPTVTMKGLNGLYALAVVSFALTGQASIISFEDISGPPAGYSKIPGGYGSTATVGVSYQTFYPDLVTQYSSYMEYWPAGYGDLPAVAYPDYNGGVGEIILTPAAGYSVTLNGFDMAAWPNSSTGTRHEDIIRILYGSMVLNYGPTDLSYSTSTHFSPDVTSSGPIAILIGTDWNNGIDHISFTATPVPEPTTMIAGALLLLPFGMSTLRMLRKRQTA